jgi:hypothetical protein
VVFLGPRLNAELVPKIHVALHACRAALPKINFKIFAKTQTSQSDQNFVTSLPLKQKFISNTQLLSPAAYYQQSISLVYCQTFYLAKSLSFPEGREATPWETLEQ